VGDSGNAMTLKVDLTPEIRAAMCPIMRTPSKCRNGWALVLGGKGEAAFRIGRKADFTEVVVPDACQANRTIQPGKDSENRGLRGFHGFSISCEDSTTHLSGRLVFFVTLKKSALSALSAVSISEFRFN
jgi:hypothetical protein